MSSFDPQEFLAVLRRVLPNDGHRVALHEPYLTERDKEVVGECVASGWVSSVGKHVDCFEKGLRELLGVEHIVACVNGTSALHICLEQVGVRPGDEVLVPALTFVGTANAIAYCGAVPHFIDSEERTLGADAAKLAEYLADTVEIRNGACWNRRTNRRVAALMIVHVFGHPADLDALLAVADRYGLPLVEDAAESLGSQYKGRATGSFGRTAALSFNGNKILTTGGGGAIVTDDHKLAEQARHLTTTAKVPHRWAFFHDRVGYNYRMPSLNAALGCAQLEQLPEFLSAKRCLARCYEEAFAGVSGLRFFLENPETKSNHWLNLVLLDEAESRHRDAVLDLTRENNIETRPVWTLMSKLPAFENCSSMDLSGAESLERRVINLPSSVSLGR